MPAHALGHWQLHPLEFMPKRRKGACSCKHISCTQKWLQRMPGATSAHEIAICSDSDWLHADPLHADAVQGLRPGLKSPRPAQPPLSTSRFHTLLSPKHLKDDDEGFHRWLRHPPGVQGESSEVQCPLFCCVSCCPLCPEQPHCPGPAAVPLPAALRECAKRLQDGDLPFVEHAFLDALLIGAVYPPWPPVSAELPCRAPRGCGVVWP